MGENEDSLQPSKKRAAGRELNRDRPELDDEEEDTSAVGGTFKKASEEVLATRRIVKVRRNQTASAPTSNPFAGIRLVPPSADSAAKLEDARETESVETDRSESKSEEAESKPVEGKDDQEGNEIDKYSDNESNQQPESKVEAAETESAEQKLDSSDKKEYDAVNPVLVDKSTADETKGDIVASDSAAEGPFSSFQQLSSSKNAFTAFSGSGFTGFSGTGFSSSAFSFGSIPKDGFSNFGVPTNGNSSIFGGSGSSKGGPGSMSSMQEVTVETGEEKEKVVFTADSVLFEFANGSWKERGKGEIKVNVAEKARLVMRAKGNFRLILNASLYPEMKLTDMDKKGVTFACINSVAEGEANKSCSLTTFAVKFKDPSIVERFREAVSAHKGGHETEPLKTPENSPKASEGDYDNV